LIKIHSYFWCWSLKVMIIVCPMTSIDYPGTRVYDIFFNYSNTRVIGSSTREEWNPLYAA
jgi:hypothetical protein